MSYNPVVYFKDIDRHGGPFKATFDKVSCDTKLEAVNYAQEMIRHIQAIEECDSINFWASLG